MPDPTPAASAARTRPHASPRVPLGDLVAWLGEQLPPGGPVRCLGTPDDVVVTGVALGSCRVQAGDLYAALAGARTHGAAYAGEAVAAGAVACLTDPDGAERCAATGVPVLVVERPRALLGALAAHVYGDPATRLTLLGVTGTQGKTTTTRLLEGALESSGTPAAVIGTVGTRVAGEDLRTSLTTPEAPDLHALFALMLERGVRACAMEVSSHALVMGRVDGTRFDVAGFLNLGHDHLDFHADQEEYFAAKATLFTPERCARAVVNVDDAHGRRLVEAARVPTRTFSTEGRDADWRAVEVRATPEGSSFTVVTPEGQRLAAGCPLTGVFNVSNALCAIALAGEAGLDAAAVAAALREHPGVPGRMERIEEGQDFLAVVDYSHKPDAVRAALETLRPLTSGRLVLVLGAGGDRDRGKRPVMGELGARLADVLVVTDDNPRSEDPARIRAALLEGARSVPEAERAELEEYDDRRAAVRAAVAAARAGDTVLVAGKGHETGQEIAGTVHPFDDRDEVRAALRARAGRRAQGQAPTR